ncbi:MAG: hemerythrin domain-containing protein [Parafilimonas sp.]
MEIKPVKRSKYIIRLSKDHHFTLLFCWKIRTGLKFNIESERIKNYVQYFWQKHMYPHFIEEETILFVLPTDEMIQKAVREHKQIAEQVDIILTSTKNAPDLFVKLANDTEQHVRYEERQLFPHLEATLTVETLEKIERQLSEKYHPAATDDYSDEFWIKPKQ